ncbi:uncharacterized protein [Argopecten irradians]|uniref:uncharacterized protein n=1 Tax=Argopecten irradians TaxID=31199 RepID=UPI0037145110
MSGNGSSTSIEETIPGENEVRTDGGILHRLGTFFRGLSLRCRHGVDKVRNRRRRKINVDESPKNSGTDRNHETNERNQEDLSNGNHSATICPEHHASDLEDTAISTLENTLTVTNSHVAESPISESQSLEEEADDTTEIEHEYREEESTNQVLPGPFAPETDNVCNSTSQSTSKQPTSSTVPVELHQVLREGDNSKKTSRETSSHKSDTMQIVKTSTSSTCLKSKTRHHIPFHSKGTKDYSKNESLISTKVQTANEFQPYRWLVDSAKTPVISQSDRGLVCEFDLLSSRSISKQESSRKTPISKTSESHAESLGGGHKTGDGGSVWNRLAPRHQRTLNFSRNYVQYGNDDTDDIELELQHTVEELCSSDKNNVGSTEHNSSSQQTESTDDSKEEHFQPVLKLGITEPREIPQGRHTQSHGILERLQSPNLDNHGDGRDEMAIVEQDLHNGLLTTPDALVGHGSTGESICALSTDSSPIVVGQQMIKNNKQDLKTNDQHPQGRYNDTPISQQPKSAISQNIMETLHGVTDIQRQRLHPELFIQQQEKTNKQDIGTKPDKEDSLKSKVTETLDSSKTSVTSNGREEKQDIQRPQGVNNQQQQYIEDDVKKTVQTTTEATTIRRRMEAPVGIHQMTTFHKQMQECNKYHQKMSHMSTITEESRAIDSQSLEKPSSPIPKGTVIGREQTNTAHSETLNKIQEQSKNVEQHILPGGQQVVMDKLRHEPMASQLSVKGNSQQSSSQPAINELGQTMKAEQCKPAAFDKESPQKPVRYKINQTSTTQMYEGNTNKVIEDKASPLERTITCQKLPETKTDYQPPSEFTMEDSTVPPTLNTKGTTSENVPKGGDTTKDETQIHESSKFGQCWQVDVHESSATYHDDALCESPTNPLPREIKPNDLVSSNKSSVSQQTIDVQQDKIHVITSSNDAATNDEKPGNTSAAKRVVVNKAFFISRLTNTRKDTNRENNNETNCSQDNPTKQGFCDDKKNKERHRSLQTKFEGTELDLTSTNKTEDVSGHRNDEKAPSNPLLDYKEPSESSCEKTLSSKGLMHKADSFELHQIQGNQIPKQTSDIDQIESIVESTHDQTTIESDFSDEDCGDYCHSEQVTNLEIDQKQLTSSFTNPHTHPSPSQQEGGLQQEIQVLLNKREKLVKPLMENIKPSPKEVTPKIIESEKNADDSTSHNDDKNSIQMPRIKPMPSQTENNEKRVVIKYKRQPYPPEGRPLSASMGTLRFRKIQGVHGQLKKAQSSEDLRGDSGVIVKGNSVNTVRNNGNQGNPTSSGYTKGKIDTYLRFGVNQNTSRDTVKKSPSRPKVMVAKKIMDRRKPVDPPSFQFDSYKVDDNMHTPSSFDYNACSPESEGYPQDITAVNKDRVNLVGLSPRELAFAQRLLPGVRKTLSPSEMENMECPPVNSPKSKHIHESNFPHIVTHKPGKTSESCVLPGMVQSENHVENPYPRSLSGSAESSKFLRNAMVERKLVLPSRYSVRSQKSDPHNPSNQVKYGSSSNREIRQQMDNRTDSELAHSTRGVYSPRALSTPKRLTNRDTIPSSLFTQTVVTSGESLVNRHERFSKGDYTGQQNYPSISSSRTTAHGESGHDSLNVKNNESSENRFSNILKTSEVLEISDACEHDLAVLQDLEDEDVSYGNMSGSKASSAFLNTAISERRSIFPSRLRSKVSSTAGVGPPVLVSHGNTTGLRYEQRKSELHEHHDDGCTVLSGNTDMKIENDGGMNKVLGVLEEDIFFDNAHMEPVADSIYLQSYDFLPVDADVKITRNRDLSTSPEDTRSTATTDNRRSHSEHIGGLRGRVQRVGSSRPTRQVQYGSSSDPRRRQQLEKGLSENVNNESKKKTFSKSTDYPRMSLALRRRMGGRNTLSSATMKRKSVIEKFVSKETVGSECGVQSQVPQSEATGLPLINNSLSTAKSASDGRGLPTHDNNRCEEKENFDKGIISDILDYYETMEGSRHDFTEFDNPEDKNVSTINMSGSEASSTFLNTAVSERRSVRPSQLRSKPQISTAVIGPPVLVPKTNTGGNQPGAETSQLNTHIESSVVGVADSENLESSDIEMNADNSKVANDSDEYQHDGSHLRQTEDAVISVALESSHNDEENSAQEKIQSSFSRPDIQLPVPKPIETLAPSLFPLNKHRLPTVSNPHRDTVATPVKVCTPPKLPTTRIEVTDDSINGGETVKPIIRKPPMESIPSVPKKIKNFRFRQKMVLTGRLHHKSEENLKFFKQITKTGDEFYTDRTKNVQ